MKTRIIAALCMLPLLIFVYLGGYWLFGIVFVIAILGTREFYKGFKSIDIKPSYLVGFISIFLLFNYFLWRDFLFDNNLYFVAWAVLSVFVSFVFGLSFKNHKVEDGVATLIGIFYIGLFSFHLVLIDQLAYNILIWMVFITALGTDTGAYFVGSFFGKRKMCPNISPKKTWEGSIGGLLTSVILSVVFSLIFCPVLLVHCIILGVLCSAIAQLGDLIASSFKRRMGIKDFGNLIPGHGGILDRFDSVIIVAPFVYYYIIFVLGY